MKEITSIKNKLIQDILKLNDKKNREDSKLFIIEGYHLVEEANKSNLLEMVLGINIDDLKNFKNIDTYLVNIDIIKKISNTINPQPIIGICKQLDNTNIDLNNVNNIVLLDDINDPGNLGTIIRTSAALGYDMVVLSNNCVDLYNDKTLRATQGSLFKIKIYKKSLIDTIKLLKNNNFFVYSTSLKDSINIADLHINKKFAVVFGNEAHGVSKEVIDLSDNSIIIPMENDCESLNVSVASGIILYELKKSL